MIVPVKLEDGTTEFRYQPQSSEQKLLYFKNMMSIFEDYAKAAEIDMETIQFDFKLINEINVRVDKRKDYYVIFHGTHLNEIREAALTAFWILKFKPFLITEQSGRQCELNINCGFAAYVILSAARESIQQRYGEDKNFKINDKKYLSRFRYALKYWDLSKEAMMMIAETLCENTIHQKEE